MICIRLHLLCCPSCFLAILARIKFSCEERWCLHLCLGNLFWEWKSPQDFPLAFFFFFFSAAGVGSVYVNWTAHSVVNNGVLCWSAASVLQFPSVCVFHVCWELETVSEHPLRGNGPCAGPSQGLAGHSSFLRMWPLLLSVPAAGHGLRCLVHTYLFVFSFNSPGTCYSGNGQFYQGWVNVTASGIPCQKWSEQVGSSVRPPKQGAALEVCFSAGLPRARQLCPIEGLTACLRSWAHCCFTASSYFSLQVFPSFLPCFRLSLPAILFSFVFLHFVNSSSKNSTQALTQSVSCSKAPHLHRRTPQVFPELADAENYCRNPGGENERPWCYTKDPSVTWEYCSVSPCGDGRWLNLWFLPLGLFWDHVRYLHPEHRIVAPTAPPICFVFLIQPAPVLLIDAFSIFNLNML